MDRSIHKVYKVELNPTVKQKIQLNKTFGCVRFVYNWCVAKFIEESKKEKEDRIPFGKFGYIKEVVELKHSSIDHSFLIDNDISSIALQQSILDFARSVSNFFRKSGSGYPKFKKKGVCRDSYRSVNNPAESIRVYGRRIYIPKLGWTRIKGKPEKYLPKDKSIQSITIYRDIDKYFISIFYKNDITIVDDNIEDKVEFSGVVGIDLGIKNLMTIQHFDKSFEIIENEDFTKKYSEKLAKEQIKLSTKQKGSKNRYKQRIKVAKIHRKIRYSRNDKIHKLTNYITSKTKNSVIMMEDLNTKSMIMKGCKTLSRSLSNVSFYEINKQMDYKALRSGSRVDYINTYYPSTQLCSSCGNIMNMELDDRNYQCSNINCNLHQIPLDRDYNSAINIREYYFKYPRLA